MKKTYISPLAAEVNVEAEQMLAASPATLNVDSSNENAVNTTGEGVQLDGGRRGEWGNLWK
ncbi:MAG: hypothetical protein IKJ95_04495 [Bacteroidaceae bacterium]|nr:hypothetical protein [Bacteroidaceae bacterium]